MEKSINFKSSINNYWFGYVLIVFATIFINLVFVKTIKNFSFEFYFLMMIPMWFGCLSINNYESEKIKKNFREYLTKEYPIKLKEFDDKPVELLNSDTEDILDLFKDTELIKDSTIQIFSKEAKKITFFMYFVFISMPVVLFSVVFIFLKW